MDDEKKAVQVQKEKARGQDGKQQNEVRVTTEDKQWLCTSCGFILGYVSEDKTEVRMKAKDFFLTVSGGKIIHPCRRCGKTNHLIDDEYLMWKSQKAILDEYIANRRLFEEFVEKRENFMRFLVSKPSKVIKKKEPASKKKEPTKGEERKTE